jgi:hypothetical protein
MFRALCKRRHVGIRYERYAHAITASVVANVHRTRDEDLIISPFDFVRDEESNQKLERKRKAKAFVNKIIKGLPITATRETLLDKRARAIADLQADGYVDAESIFDELFPHLKGG